MDSHLRHRRAVLPHRPGGAANGGGGEDAGELACAASGGRAHPVFGLWPVRLAEALRQALVADDIRKIDRWTARYVLTQVEFCDAPIDPFFNVNVPADLAEAERPTA